MSKAPPAKVKARPTKLDPARQVRGSQETRALARMMSGAPSAGRSPAAKLSPVQQAKAFVNEVRRKLENPRLSERTAEKYRAMLAGGEAHLRGLLGPEAHRWSDSGAIGPAFVAEPGTVLLDGWSLNDSSHEEKRRFRSGESLLGYLENRPGVVTLLAARHSSGLGDAAPRAAVPADVQQRIESLGMVLSAPEDKRPDLIRNIAAAWGMAEAGRERRESRTADGGAGGDGGGGRGDSGGGFDDAPDLGEGSHSDEGDAEGGDGEGEEEDEDDGEDPDWYDDLYWDDDYLDVEFEVDFDSGGVKE